MDKKLIIANGCSMATGFECTVPGQQHNNDWQYSWPAKIANHYSIDHINLSRPGQSNYSISINLQSEILKTLKYKSAEDILVIVGWTEFTREEYISDKFCFQLNAGLLDNVLKGRIPKNTPVELQNILEHSLKAWINRSLDSYVNQFIWTYWSLVQFLKNYNIKYFFFNSMNKVYCPKQNPLFSTRDSEIIDPAPDVWDTLINDHCYDNESTQNDFLQINKPNCSIGEGIGQKHWNPEALDAWANYLITKIDSI
jgi:hypothetical protein